MEFERNTKSTILLMVTLRFLSSDEMEEPRCAIVPALTLSGESSCPSWAPWSTNLKLSILTQSMTRLGDSLTFPSSSDWCPASRQVRCLLEFHNWDVHHGEILSDWGARPGLTILSTGHVNTTGGCHYRPASCQPAEQRNCKYQPPTNKCRQAIHHITRRISKEKTQKCCNN